MNDADLELDKVLNASPTLDPKGDPLEDSGDLRSETFEKIDVANELPIISTNRKRKATAPPVPQEHIRFQFSLLTFFMVTAGVGISSGLLFSLNNLLLVYFTVIFRLMLTVALTVTLIYGTGYLRTFCVGALVVNGITVISSASLFAIGLFALNGMGNSGRGATGGFVFRPLILAEWIAIFLMGLFAMLVRFLVERTSARTSNR